MIAHKSVPRLFLFVFLLVSFIDIIAIITNNFLLQTLSKPLIIPALMAYYMTSSVAINKLFLLALFFSWLGDVLLLDKMNLFLFGIAAFLLTQLLYVAIVSKILGKSSMRQKVLAAAPFAIFFFTLIYVLQSGLQDYFIPVVIYGIAISVFGSVSLLNNMLSKHVANRHLLTGAILFILSDSMIALNKFQEPRSFYPVAIMLTYIIAQYLITSFMLLTENETSHSQI